MFSKLKTYFYIVLYSIPLLVCFSFASVKGFCLAQESFLLDDNSLTVLNGGQNSAYNQSKKYGVNADPNLVVFGIDNILNDINMQLYDRYGWDLETVSWQIEDAVTDEIKSEINRNIALGATVASGFELYESTLVNSLTGAKDYILGQVDNVTGKITNVFNNVYTYLSDSFINKLTGVKRDLFNDGYIANNSNTAYYFSNSISCSWSNSTNSYSAFIKFNKPVFSLCESDNSRILLVYPNNYNLSITGRNINVMRSNGIIDQYYGISSNGFNLVSSFTVGDTTYGVYSFYIKYGINNANIQPKSSKAFSNLTDIRNFIMLTDPFNTGFTYSYDTNDYSAILSILNRLKNHYVTTDDLRQLNDKLDGLTLGNIVIDNNSLPILDTDYANLSDLQQLVNEILNRNATVNDYLTENMPEPEPNPNPNPNPEPNPEVDFGGTTLPDDFEPFGWTPLFDAIKLPFEFSSLFQPLFYVFGSFAGLWAIWTFVPLAILILLFIWALK